MIISIRLEYLKPYTVCKLFVLDRNTYYHISILKKTLKQQLHKNVNINVQCTRFPNFLE